MSTSLGIGQLGYGSIGKIHTLGYRAIGDYYPGVLPDIRLAAVCTSRPESAEKAAAAGGFARGYSKLEDIASDPTVSVIDCALPNYSHLEALRVALAAGKHVYCEKPLCVNAEEAREIASFAAGLDAKVGMTFNYRFVPAIRRAKELIDTGALGEVYSFQLTYLHTGYQDASRPLSWRMQQELSGGGALVDLGSHIIDLVRYLLGDVEEVLATTRTFITERPVARSSEEKGPVTVDDAAWMQMRLASGSVGTLEVSRFATGSLDDLTIRIEGENGALKFDLMDGNWLYWYNARRGAGALGDEKGWTRLETAASFPGAVIPPARSILGWARMHAENQFRFLQSVVEGSEPSPGLADGLAVQLILAAAYESAATGTWSRVPAL